MKTRNGIYHDLHLSSYCFLVCDTHLVFIFSSDLHLTKFEEQYEIHRKEFNVKLNSRYRVNVNFKAYADILLYKKIENRGFLIVNEGGQKLCLENLQLNGEKVTLKN